MKNKVTELKVYRGWILLKEPHIFNGNQCLTTKKHNCYFICDDYIQYCINIKQNCIVNLVDNGYIADYYIERV